MSVCAPGGSRALYRVVSALLVSVLVLVAVFAGSTPAAAAPPSSGRVDVDKWPASLRAMLPGTKEFTAKYMAKTAGQPCSQESGGNPYKYVMDYLDHTGEVFQMISHTSGRSVLAITDIGGARTDMPAFSSVQDLEMKDGAAIPPFLTAVGTVPHSVDGKGWCGMDFAQFGVADPTAPFGFTYYSAPDGGSKKFIDTSVSQFGTVNPGYKKYWANRYEHGFDARNLDSYCAQDNPFCLTASFLHCDQRNGDKPNANLVGWCQTWNYQVAMYNVRIMEFVRFYGTNAFDAQGNPTGPLKPLDIASNAVRDTPAALGAPVTDPAAIGHGGYLARWAAAMAIPDYISYLRAFGKALSIGTAVALGAAAGIAAFWLGAGLLAALAIGGAVAALTVFEGACNGGWAKCLAQAAAEGMAFQLGAVPEAATAVQIPNMNTTLWKSTFNDVATLSLAMLIVLFVMNLIMSLVSGKPVLIVRSFLGVIGWSIVLSVGGAILALVIQARNSATTILSGGAGYMNKLVNKMVAAINQLGSDQSFTGWLWVALLCLIAMLCGLVVYAVLYISAAWIPLVVAVLILQLAGWAAPGLSASKWFRRGLAIMWSILITPPAIVLLWRAGTAWMGESSSMATLIVGVVTLLASATAFSIVTGLFSLGASGRLGIAGATIGSIVGAIAGAKAVGGMMGGGASSRPGKSAAAMTDDQLAGARTGARSMTLSSVASTIAPVPASAGAGAGGGSLDASPSDGSQEKDPRLPTGERAGARGRAAGRRAGTDRPGGAVAATVPGDATTAGAQEAAAAAPVAAAVVAAGAPGQLAGGGRRADADQVASPGTVASVDSTAPSPRHRAGDLSDATASPEQPAYNVGDATASPDQPPHEVQADPRDSTGVIGAAAVPVPPAASRPVDAGGPAGSNMSPSQPLYDVQPDPRDSAGVIGAAAVPVPPAASRPVDAGGQAGSNMPPGGDATASPPAVGDAAASPGRPAYDIQPHHRDSTGVISAAAVPVPPAASRPVDAGGYAAVNVSPAADAVASPPAVGDAVVRRATPPEASASEAPAPDRSVSAPPPAQAPQPRRARDAGGPRVLPASVTPAGPTSSGGGPGGAGAVPSGDQAASSVSAGGPPAVATGPGGADASPRRDGSAPWDVPPSDAASPPSASSERQDPGAAADLPPWHEVDRPWTSGGDAPDRAGDSQDGGR